MSLTRTANGNVAFSVYPNPATDKLHVNASEDDVVVVKDFSGRSVLQTPIGRNATIDLNGLGSGICFAIYQTSTHRNHSFAKQ